MILFLCLFTFQAGLMPPHSSGGHGRLFGGGQWTHPGQIDRRFLKEERRKPFWDELNVDTLVKVCSVERSSSYPEWTTWQRSSRFTQNNYSQTKISFRADSWVQVKPDADFSIESLLNFVCRFYISEDPHQCRCASGGQTFWLVGLQWVVKLYRGHRAAADGCLFW